MKPFNLNVVTCGHCGDIFAHTLNLGSDELTCPYCKRVGDPSDFPDLFYPPEYHDSIITVDKELLA